MGCNIEQSMVASAFFRDLVNLVVEASYFAKLNQVMLNRAASGFSPNPR